MKELETESERAKIKSVSNHMASAVATRQAAVAIADIFLVAHDDDEKHHDAKEEDYQSAAEVIALQGCTAPPIAPETWQNARPSYTNWC